MWKWMGLSLRKNHLLRYWGWLSLLNWIGALKLSILLKLPKRILEPWFALWSSFLLKLLCIYINLPYCHVWNPVVMPGLVRAPSCFLELLDKLQKRICRTAGPSLPASLKPLVIRWNVASLSFFYGYYFQAPKFLALVIIIYHYCNLDLAVMIAKIVQNVIVTIVFGPVFGYTTSSMVILKSNSFKGCFNLATFYDFQNFCQDKVESLWTNKI